MRFRQLDKEERELFKDDFVKFLALNGIDAESWHTMKADNLDKAEGILNTFSDMIFDTVLRKQQYVEHWTPRQINAFHFIGDKMLWFAAKTETDVTNENALEILKSGNYSLTFSEKAFVKSREEEMFALLEQGCQMSDGELYKKFALLLAAQKDV